MQLSSFAWASQQPPVTITLQSVTVSNDGWYGIVFSVTNAGTKPVHLSSCRDSRTPTNVVLPLGLFGSCDIAPGTNASMRLNFRPYKSGVYWWRYVVFEEASLLQKSELAGARLKANLTGKSNYSNLWISNLSSAAYEITSPSVKVSAKGSPDVTKRPSDSSDDGAFATDGTSDPLADFSQFLFAEPNGAANRSQPVQSATNSTPLPAGSGR